MIIKGIIDEDLINYKKPGMVIEFPRCDFKCDRECGRCICQNSALVAAADIEISISKLVYRYSINDITQAIVFQGLEPFDSWNDLIALVMEIRSTCNDDIVIYTGYNENEVKSYINFLSKFENIIIKFGRYIPDQESHYDEVLGVELASPNQYAKRIS